MADYTCSWIIQVDADSADEAAALAEEMVLDNSDYARFWFVVNDEDPEAGAIGINLSVTIDESFED